MTINKQIALTSVVLIATVIFFGISNVDLFVQDLFFVPQTNSWILPSDAQPYKFIFYDGIKRVLIAFVVILLFGAVLLRKKSWMGEYKRGVGVVILSAILVPGIVGGLKKYTNMPCPKHEIRYGGEMPRTAVWQSYDEVCAKMPHIKCWPAGHASGGFALLSLFFLFKSKRNKKIAIISAICIGWSMGLYKMMVGDHFLSHTVITMVLAWLIILIIAKFTLRGEYV